MTDHQQQLPLPSSSALPMSSDSLPSEPIAVVKSSNDEIEPPAMNSQSPIFHVLLLPGGSVRKDADEDNKPNVIIDDYLYQRYVFRKKAELRAANSNSLAGRIRREETNNDDIIDAEIPLNLLASPLEIALVSCCVRPSNTDQDSLEEEQNNSTAQRSRLHRPINPSNAGEEDEEEEDNPLDTPRTISMKDTNEQHYDGNNDNLEIGTLQKGQEAHFLKLLQMYCPQNEGLMYRSLAVAILQRTADWENRDSNRNDDGSDDAPTSNNNMASSSSSTNVNDSRGKVEIGQVGYTFRKRFHSGWYTGKITEIIPRTHSNHCAKDRRCVYTDGDVEDLSLEELKHLAELEELESYYHADEDEQQQQVLKKEEEAAGDHVRSGCGSGDGIKSEAGGNNESSAASQVAATPTPPINDTNSSSSNEHIVLKTFLAVGGMKLLARWLVEAYTVVQPPPPPPTSNKKRSSSQMAEVAVVCPSPSGALLLPLLTLLKSIPFDKDVIVASSIHKYIKRYKKALDKLSKGANSESLNDIVHPLAGGGSVGKAMRGVEEVMTSWNKATAALKASSPNDNGSNSDDKRKELDPYKDLRDQLQSRFDELAAFHNNRTNPPEWVPKHVLGVVMASPKAAPASPTSSSKPVLNSSSLKSNTLPTKNAEWGTNRKSAAQLARDRFLEGFRKQKESVSASSTGLVPSPPQKMQKVSNDNNEGSLLSKKVCWADKPVRKGLSPQPLVTERVFVKEEEYVEDEVEMQEMFGGEDGKDEGDVQMQENNVDVEQGDTVNVMEDPGGTDEQEDSDLDDMF